MKQTTCRPQSDSPKRRSTFIKIHGVTSHNIQLFTYSAPLSGQIFFLNTSDSTSPPGDDFVLLSETIN
jgi:hypothetical protein